MPRYGKFVFSEHWQGGASKSKTYDRNDVQTKDGKLWQTDTHFDGKYSRVVVKVFRHNPSWFKMGSYWDKIQFNWTVECKFCNQENSDLHYCTGSCSTDEDTWEWKCGCQCTRKVKCIYSTTFSTYEGCAEKMDYVPVLGTGFRLGGSIGAAILGQQDRACQEARNAGWNLGTDALGFALAGTGKFGPLGAQVAATVTEEAMISGASQATAHAIVHGGEVGVCRTVAHVSGSAGAEMFSAAAPYICGWRKGDVVRAYFKTKNGDKSETLARGVIENSRDDQALDIKFDNGVVQKNIPVGWICPV